MDMNKICEKLISDETIKDIPLAYVFRIAFSIFTLIESGECFYHDEYE